jgi:Flp pilus assembly protein CpaB
MGSPLHRSRLSSALTLLGGWPRRAAAVLCLCLAVLSAVSARSPAPTGASTDVVVAVRDLRPGALLTAGDVRIQAWPDANAPPSALHRVADVVGHQAGGSLARGEPVTTARLLDTSILSALRPGQVAVTIALSDQSQAAILHAGALVDLYARAHEGVLADGKPVSSSGAGRGMATAVRILAVLPNAEGRSPDGPSIVIAADSETASHLANLPSGPFLATLRPPS